MGLLTIKKLNMSDFIVGNISQTCHSKVRSLAEYWQAIHPAAGLPGRQHLDPCDIEGLLPHIFLVDIDVKSLDFTWRLMGTNLVDIFAGDHTGKAFEGAYRDGTEAHAYKAMCNIVGAKQPNWRRAPASFAKDREYLTMERAIFPLARDSTTVDMALGIILGHRTSGDVV